MFIEAFLQSAERDSFVDVDLFKGASADEAAELRDVLEDAKRIRERRSWVKAMLTQSGSSYLIHGSLERRFIRGKNLCPL